MQRQAPDYIEADLDADDTLADAAPADAIVLDARDGAGERVDRYLAARLPEYSRTRIQRWLALGAVLVDGRSALPKQRLSGLESIEVRPLPTEAERSFEPDPVALTIVHEDAHVLVVDKPAELVTHPAPGNWRNTLMNGLLHARPDSARLPRAGIVHRLDRDTSGLLVVARSESAFERLTHELAARRIDRRYLALAEGATGPQGTIDAPIGRDPRDRLRMAVVAAHGKPARTHWRLLGLGRAPGGAAVSLLECTLETGRTHQIRVHLASLGAPLVGDATYGGRPLAGFARQALHAWRLAFAHPADGRRLDLCSEPPSDLKSLIEDCDLAAPLRRLYAAAARR